MEQFKISREPRPTICTDAAPSSACWCKQVTVNRYTTTLPALKHPEDIRESTKQICSALVDIELIELVHSINMLPVQKGQKFS